MKDPPLRLLPCSSASVSAHAKWRSLTAKPFRRQRRSEAKREYAQFPRGEVTLYLTAVKPEEMSKTDRAYHEVTAQRFAIRPDREAKVQSFEEPKPADAAKPPPAQAENSSFCVCNRPYERGELMFKCEGYCGNWYHPKCLGMAEVEIDRHCKTKERWYCNDCYERAHKLLVAYGPQKKGK